MNGDLVVIGLWVCAVTPLWVAVLAGRPDSDSSPLDVAGWRIIYSLAVLVTSAMSALALLAAGP